jgi:hypothetical protein
MTLCFVILAQLAEGTMDAIMLLLLWLARRFR